MAERRSLAAALAAGAALAGCGGETLTLAPAGPETRVSRMGPDGDPRSTAGPPAVAFDPRRQRFLVVWAGNDGSRENEIWARFLDAEGRPDGPQFPVSSHGPRGAPASPAVVHNPRAGEFLVVWRARAGSGFEIHAQRLEAEGREVGSDDFRISDMSPDGGGRFGAFEPAVAFNGRANEYLVVWRGNEEEGEREIFAQRLAADGRQLGVNDRQISSAGPPGSTRISADFPGVAYDAHADAYLVAWEGDADVDNEIEIFARPLDATGAASGPVRRVSTAGPARDAAFDARTVVLAAGGDEFLAVWWADDRVDDEFEVYARAIAGDGTPRGEQARLSHMGVEGDPAFSALVPAVVATGRREYAAAWWGDTGVPPLEDNEVEIYAVRVRGGRAAGPFARISRAGPDGEYLAAALDPALAHDPGQGRLLAAWLADPGTAPLADNEFEVFARLVTLR